jgi:protocatechuate 3,4-dioxygenase alpha subunit
MTEPSPTPIRPTASQTIGPFFKMGVEWAEATELVDPGAPGAVTIEGRVLDGDGAPVPDAVVEIWQADAQGRFPPATDQGWTGFGRALTGPDGGFRFVTLAPGPVDDRQAPHIDVSVFARGLLQRVVTRCYLPGDTDAHARDPLLSGLDPDRRSTLVAMGEGDVMRFDVHLQGDQETVFLAW